MTKTVFFTGATGYVGGATLAHLLASPSTASFTYSALVRSREKASMLESLGVRPVIGSLDDAALLSAEAEKADYVIHTDLNDELRQRVQMNSGPIISHHKIFKGNPSFHTSI
ncbi:hypothetical protein JB92DRAFT_3118626 [Gautieria morchelliformis]|nr:hypothetical protein JB92DRAFT_3118626 [Gautieria morchelliformis]